MDNQHWHDRWAQQRIGFHQTEVSPYLEAHWAAVHSDPAGTVFVPLCGKSLDMLWLAERGYDVVGVEISEIAATAFFTENGLPFERHHEAPFDVYRGERITIYCGDFFELNSAHLAEVRAVFDRASLIALPPEARARYATHLQALIEPTVPLMVILLEYPDQQMQGPPYSVRHDEAESLFGARYQIQVLQSTDVLDQEPHFQSRGITSLRESVLRLTHSA